MKHILKYFIFFFAFAACNTVAKQQRKAETFYMQHPEKLAKKCADTYVEKDSAGGTDTVYVKADNTDYTKKIDSIQNALDSAIEYAAVIQVHDTDSSAYKDEVERVISLKNQFATLKLKYKPCKPDTLILLDTVFKQSTSLLASNAYYSYQNDSLKTALVQRTTQKDDARRTSKNRLWWIIGLAVAFAGSVFLNVKKIFV